MNIDTDDSIYQGVAGQPGQSLTSEELNDVLRSVIGSSQGGEYSYNHE